MKIVCISGKARHGKDTCAEFLKKDLIDRGYSVQICHYGDLVKYICSTFFEWDGQKNEYGRRLLQFIGTDIVRAQEPEYWVHFLIDIVRFFGDGWDYVLIPDCRFPNEIFEWKKWKFDTVHLRVIRENFESSLPQEQQEHISETALDNCRPDCWVYNDGSLSDLQVLISKFADTVLLGDESQMKE